MKVKKVVKERNLSYDDIVSDDDIKAQLYAQNKPKDIQKRKVIEV